MKNFKTLLFVSLALLTLGSCSIERRIHNKGFHVEWNKKYTSANAKESKQDDVAEENRKPYAPERSLAEKGTTSDVLALENEKAISADDNPESSHSEYEEARSAEKLLVVHNDVQQETRPTEETATTVAAKKVSKKAKKAKSSSNSGGSSQIIALILVIFLGLLGIHRFYLGYTGIGILMLLTAGVFGILALIDLIRIVMGTLKPKNGEYTEKL